tara:strand:+ start:156 stop:947 length:792 start_codon:yes stop_codon:yes gene_type:complete
MIFESLSDGLFWSKWLPQLVYPLNLSLYLSLVALLLIWKGRQHLATLLLSAAILVVLIFSSPLSVMLYHNHETIHRSGPISDLPRADAIVVLSGDVGIPVPPRQYSQIGGNRLLHAFRLFQAQKAPLIIISGGNVFQNDNVESEALYSLRILREWGVEQESILAESGSRNTFENALNTKKLLQAHRISKILLVTDALHMPRAFSTFQHTGIDVVASPSGYAVAEYSRPTLLQWWPKVENLMIAKRVIREKLGIMVYRLRGWSD